VVSEVVGADGRIVAFRWVVHVVPMSLRTRVFLHGPASVSGEEYPVPGGLLLLGFVAAVPEALVEGFIGRALCYRHLFFGHHGFEGLQVWPIVPRVSHLHRVNSEVGKK